MPVIVVTGQRQMQGPVGIGTSPVAGSALALSDGTAAHPAVTFGNDPNTGLYSTGPDTLGFASNGVLTQSWWAGWWTTNASGAMGWAAAADPNGAKDVVLQRDAAGVLKLYQTASTPAAFRIYAGNGAYWELGSDWEEVTIAAAASTLSTKNLLPANSIIEAVTVFNTVAIPGPAATYSVGVTGTAARFGAGIAVAQGTSAVCLAHSDQTGAGGPKQSAAAQVLITPNANPGAATGKVRVVTCFRRFVAPTV